MIGKFEKLEILGKVKKFKEEGYFYNLIKEGSVHIEELLIDSILKKQ